MVERSSKIREGSGPSSMTQTLRKTYEKVEISVLFYCAMLSFFFFKKPFWTPTPREASCKVLNVPKS